MHQEINDLETFGPRGTFFLIKCYISLLLFNTGLVSLGGGCIKLQPTALELLRSECCAKGYKVFETI
jgi:hypothetical protein